MINEKLTDAYLEETLYGIRDQMWEILSDDETAQGMTVLVSVHSEANDLAGMKSVIEAIMANRLQEAAERRIEILEKIEAYETTQQP